jgi:hypothetical protein
MLYAFQIFVPSQTVCLRSESSPVGLNPGRR